MKEINYRYIQELTSIFHKIEHRGILVDVDRILKLDSYLEHRKSELLKELVKLWGVPLILKKDDSIKNAVNLSSPKQLLKLLKDLRYDVPKLPPNKDKRDRGIDEWQESTGKLALQLIFSKTSDDAVLKLLKISELETLQSRYVRARLMPCANGDALFISQYNVSGTLSGRRSSTKHIFGYGGNGQNFPKHTETGEMFLSCLIPHPGKIFLMCDQKSAEDWPVCGLSENYDGLDELKKGINRHKKLASFLFNKPIDSVNKEGIEYFLGKKTRHANNYGMQKKRMSLSLIELGRYVDEKTCDILLQKINAYEPKIKTVFHRYIENEINKKRVLVTPLGRERQFMGFRPGSSNKNIFGEAYSYIPQSLVGDNTGLAIRSLETTYAEDSYVIQDGHDSITQELDFDLDTLKIALQNLEKSFDRTIRFDHNGIEFKIPIEVELALSFSTKDRISLRDPSPEEMERAFKQIKEKIKPNDKTQEIDLDRIIAQNV